MRDIGGQFWPFLMGAVSWLLQTVMCITGVSKRAGGKMLTVVLKLLVVCSVTSITYRVLTSVTTTSWASRTSRVEPSSRGVAVAEATRKRCVMYMAATVLYCTLLYFTALCCAVLCCVLLCCVYYTVLTVCTNTILHSQHIAKYLYSVQHWWVMCCFFCLSPLFSGSVFTRWWCSDVVRLNLGGRLYKDDGLVSDGKRLVYVAWLAVTDLPAFFVCVLQARWEYMFNEWMLSVE